MDLMLGLVVCMLLCSLVRNSTLRRELRDLKEDLSEISLQLMLCKIECVLMQGFEDEMSITSEELKDNYFHAYKYIEVIPVTECMYNELTDHMDDSKPMSKEGMRAFIGRFNDLMNYMNALTDKADSEGIQQAA